MLDGVHKSVATLNKHTQRNRNFTRTKTQINFQRWERRFVQRENELGEAEAGRAGPHRQHQLGVPRAVEREEGGVHQRVRKVHGRPHH